MGASPIDRYFEPQMLRQEGDMDCGVCVFGALAELSREELLSDAVNGKTVEQWEEYLRGKGFTVIRYQNSDEPLPPCAHLVEGGAGFHWIYQAKDGGGIHDPSPV